MTQLTIRSIHTTAVSVPLKYPVRTASGDIIEAPLLLIDLVTEQGITGHTYLFTYTPLVLKPLKGLLDNLSALLKGVDCAPHALEAMLDARFRLLGNTGLVTMAMAGIDMAAWDALARAKAQPLACLLGASVPDAGRGIPAYLSLGLDGVARGTELAHECLEQGFGLMKIKLGYASLEEDIKVASAVVSVLGSQALLAVDYNQCLTVPEALRRCQALEELGLAWIEEPTRQDDYLGHARIAAQIDTPIMIGENWFGTHEMHKALSVQASDYVMPDVMKIGGVTAWIRAASLAHAARMPMASHLFQETSAHLMTVTPTMLRLEYLPLADPILESPMKIHRGMAIIENRPGCGIEWNSQAVEKFKLP